MAYLIHPVEGAAESIIDTLKFHVGNISPADMLSEVATLQKSSNGAISAYRIPVESGPALASAESGVDISVLRKFGSPVERDWLITSFSSLAASRQKRLELPDYDREPEDTAGGSDDYKNKETIGNLVVDEENTITDFPRGTLAGTFFHKLLEELDFGKSLGMNGYLENYIGRKLEEHGYSLDWKEPVSSMVRNIVTADLDDCGTRLANVSTSERLNELEFYLPIKHISPEFLSNLFRKFTQRMSGFSAGFPERLGNLEFSPRRGYMRGFIDLVFKLNGSFYLVDWKSNFLGHQSEDYSPAKLKRSMEEHFYFLQYHFYCLALHEYLKRRMPGYSYEKSFGGGYYIYLRGFGKPGLSGIFRGRPEQGLIEAMEEGLMRSGKE